MKTNSVIPKLLNRKRFLTRVGIEWTDRSGEERIREEAEMAQKKQTEKNSEEGEKWHKNIEFNNKQGEKWPKI